MLNNITNFFNLIKNGMVKTQLEAKDVIPIGTKDASYGGTYKPTLIEYANFVAGLVGGSNGQVLFNDADTIAGASNLYWDKVNNRLSGGPTPTTSNFVIQKDITNDFIMYSPATYGGIQTFPTGGGANTVVNAKLSGTHGGYGNVAMGLGTVQADGSAFFGSTAIGQASYARGIYGLALGCEAKSGSASTAPTAATAIGYNALSTRNYSVALGYNSVAAIDNAIALGNSASLLQIGGNFTPLARTHIRGLGNTSATTSLLVENSSGTEMFRVLDDGKVGIGTSSPAFTFEVKGKTLLNSNTASTNSILKLTDGNNATFWLGMSTSSTISTFFGANGTLTIGKVSADNSEPSSTHAKITLNRLGNPSLDLETWSPNVGISFSDGNNATIRMNYPSPGEAAITTISSHNLSIGVASGVGSLTSTTMKFFQSTGNIGINTTTDAGYKLDVNGMVRVSSIIYFTNGNTQIFQNLNDLYFAVGSGINRLVIKSTGNILIGTTTDVASSLLTLESTTKGFLPPRMTNAERTAIASPAVGLMVYQTDGTEGLYVYKSTGWALNS